MTGEEKDVKEYLARIRKTIAESEAMVSKVHLRMAETDRMLEQQGLTREQVMNMRFTAAQREAANRELERRGFQPFEDWEEEMEAQREAYGAAKEAPPRDISAAASGDEFAERQKKFSMMMKPFQI